MRQHPKRSPALMIAAACVCCALAAVGDEQPTQRSAPEVRVRVVDEAGAPLPRARVILWPEPWIADGVRNAVTDRSGEAVFTDYVPGIYDIYADVAGRPVAARLHNHAGEQAAVHTIQVPRGVLLSGTLVDDRGEPWAGAVVGASRYANGNGPDTWEDAASRVDESGTFHLAGVPTGVSSLRIDLSGDGDRYHADTWFEIGVPAGTEALEMLPLRVSRRGTVRVEFARADGVPFVERGTDESRGGQSAPAEHPEILRAYFSDRRYPAESSDVIAISTSSGEPIEQEVAPGPVRIELGLRGYRFVGGNKPRPNPEPWDGLDWWSEVVVAAGGTTTIRLLVEPVPPGEGGALVDEFVVQVVRVEGDGTRAPLPEAWVTLAEQSETADASGRVRFRDVPIGKHVLEGWADPGFAGRRTVAVDEGVPAVELALAMDRGVHPVRLTGTVATASPLGGTEIELDSVDGAPHYGWAQTPVEPDGSFELEGDLPEGPYAVDLRRNRSSLGKAIVWVGPESEQHMDIVLTQEDVEPSPPSGTIRGKIRGGQPGEFLHLRTEFAGPVSHYVSPQVRGDGSFELDDLPMGEWLLETGGWYCQPWVRTTVTVAADAVTEVELALPETRLISGRVLGDTSRVNTLVTGNADGECTGRTTIAADGSFGPVSAPLTGGMLAVTEHWGPFEWAVHTMPIEADTEEMQFEVRPASLVIRVVHQGSGAPVAHGYFWLFQEARQVHLSGWGPALRPDENGEIEVPGMSPGDWVFRSDRAEARFYLEPGESKYLVVREPEGEAPRIEYPGGERPAIKLDFSSETGRHFFGVLGGQWPELPELPPGTYSLHATSDYGYDHSVDVEVPGPPAQFPAHPPRGALRVLVPETYLHDVDLVAEITDLATGEKFSAARSDPREHRERARERGLVDFPHVPAGDYEVVVRSSDGRAFHGRASVLPFVRNEAKARSR